MAIKAICTVTLTALSVTIVIFNLFHLLIISLLLGMKYVFEHKDFQMFSLKLNKYK